MFQKILKIIFKKLFIKQTNKLFNKYIKLKMS